MKKRSRFKSEVKRKVIVYAISICLMLLFVLTLDNVITGRTVLNQMKIDLSYYPYPFIKNYAYNDLYIVLGYSFSAEELAAAKDIALGLQSTRFQPPKIVVENDLPKGIHNLIILGTPCTNELVAKTLKSSDCNFGEIGLKEGEGLLYLIPNKRNAYLIVSGYSNDDTKKAANVLKYYKFYPLKGKIVKVYGNLEDPYSISLLSTNYNL